MDRGLLNHIALIVMIIPMSLSQLTFAASSAAPRAAFQNPPTQAPVNAPPPNLAQQAPAMQSTTTSVTSAPPPPVSTNEVSQQETASAPVAPPSQADLSQFQKWLASNGQNPSETIPPPPSAISPPSSNTAEAKSDVPGTIEHKPKKTTKVKILTGPDAPVVQSPPLTYEQSQAIMLKSAPPPVVPQSPDSEEVFNSMMQQNVPLSPQQVVRLRQLVDSSQRAASIPATIPPKPVSSTLLINLAPGATPPAIRIAQGYISSLVFVDSTGAPWPLASYDIGDPKATTIYWDGKSNILRIQAITPYSEGNLMVQLVGLPTPLSLELVSGQRVVDYRTDIHVPGIGPNSNGLPTGSGLPESANQLLLNVLDGVAPPGSKQLKVSGGDCQAWLLDDKMFLRTRLTVLSPGWQGKMTSPDGMYAYEIQRTSSVLVSQYGNPIALKIEGF